ncbi:MAG TPA: DUF4097 family beta strand repeat-containing protein [Vicinamibacterales bacterium]|nr:DUF4097 family beta strand repeat-containing protein [Vicinamibacterales bacterium]
MRRLAPLAGVVLIASAVAGSACAINVDHEGYIEHDEKRFDAPAVVDLHLETFDGSIDVRAWDRAEISVSIEKRGPTRDAVSRIEVVANRSGDRIDLEARYPGPRGGFIGFGHSPSARLVANVPRKTNVVMKTSDGGLRVERVDGRLELRTGDGGIKAIETAGSLLAETTDGTIEIEDIAGQVEARTDDGSFHLSGTPSVLRARTGDGSMVLRIRHGAAMAADWTVATNDGSISLELPDGFDADIEADPGAGGRTRSEVALVNVTGGTRDNRTLRGRFGDGGHSLRIRTDDGTIRLTKY